jgi:hypothetical protein
VNSPDSTAFIFDMFQDLRSLKYCSILPGLYIDEGDLKTVDPGAVGQNLAIYNR